MTVGDVDRSKLPIRRQTFDGVINKTLDGSQPDWNLIGHPTPPEGAPNVLLVLIDDAELLMQSEISPDLVALTRGAAGNGWGLVAGGNAEAMSLGLAGWIGQVKRNRTGLLLSPQSITEGELLGVRLSRGVIGQAPQLGRGYLHLGDGTLRTVQVPETRIEG